MLSRPAIGLSLVLWLLIGLALCGFNSDGIQDPPQRFSVAACDVRVAFRTPERISQLCPAPPAGFTTRGCWKPAQNAIFMPNPWQCGSAEGCAALWRHELAHACRGWAHEVK